MLRFHSQMASHAALHRDAKEAIRTIEKESHENSLERKRLCGGNGLSLYIVFIVALWALVAVGTQARRWQWWRRQWKEWWWQRWWRRRRWWLWPRWLRLRWKRRWWRRRRWWWRRRRRRC